LFLRVRRTECKEERREAGEESGQTFLDSFWGNSNRLVNFESRKAKVQGASCGIASRSKRMKLV